MEELGPSVLMLIEEILQMEVKMLVNDERVFSPPSRLSPAMARSFTFDSITSAFAQQAPFTWELVRTLSGVDIPDMNSDELLNMDPVDENDNDDEDNAGDEDDEDDESQARILNQERRLNKGQQPKHPSNKLATKMNVRNKLLMATTGMAVMLNSRNERLNHFQNMVSSRI